ERDGLQQALHHRMQTRGADVFGALVYLERDFGDALDAVGGELERDAFGLQQRGVLGREAGFGVGEDADEVLGRERIEFDADGQAALQLGDQIRGPSQVERARGDEQDVVGFYLAVLGRDRTALDQRQQVALHA